LIKVKEEYDIINWCSFYDLF